MVAAFDEPAGQPCVLGPASSYRRRSAIPDPRCAARANAMRNLQLLFLEEMKISGDANAAAAAALLRLANASRPTEEQLALVSRGSMQQYYLHPAAQRRCSPNGWAEEELLQNISLNNLAMLDVARAPMANRRSTSSACNSDEAHSPMLAWEESKQIPDDFIDVIDNQPWVVVHVCGAGSQCVGDALVIQAGVVWTCFGNVMLARRGQQFMLCRHAAFSQMMNFQCASNGWDIAVNDCRCSPDGWCMLISDEQACMNALADFLKFMLTTTSKVLFQFGVPDSAAHVDTCSLLSWQTSCLKTNGWVTESGTKMWDVVFNGKNVMGSSFVKGQQPTVTSTSIDFEDSDVQLVPTLQLQQPTPCMQSYGAEQFCCETASLKFPLYQQLFEQFAASSMGESLAQLALEDGEADVESEIIDDTLDCMQPVCCEAAGCDVLLKQPVASSIEATVAGSALQEEADMESEFINETSSTNATRTSSFTVSDHDASAQARVEDTKPLVSEADIAGLVHSHSSKRLPKSKKQADMQTFQQALLPEEAEAVRPAKPTSKKVMSRPHSRIGRSKKSRETPCPSFCMDAEEPDRDRHRESSLARSYDALGAEFSSLSKVSSATSANRDMFFRMDAGELDRDRQRESSLARSYDALDAEFSGLSRVKSVSSASKARESSLARSYNAFDDIKAPAELPPVRARPSKKTSSRFSNRHRATLAAAAAMACDLDNRDIRDAESSMTHPSVQRTPSEPCLSADLKRLREFQAAASPVSAMALDMDESTSRGGSMGFESAGIHSLPTLKPFAISASKLPPLPAQKMWRMPAKANNSRIIRSNEDF